MAVSRGHALGGEGAVELARKVVAVADGNPNPSFKPLYSLEDSFLDKVRGVARGAYGTDSVVLTKDAARDLKAMASLGLDKLPVCIAKTPASLSDDPKLLGAPTGFDITVREIQVAAGAGFLVPITGDILRMPGLPRVPASVRMGIEGGEIVGLS